MPVKYVGRNNFYVGKTIYDIATNLKNYGVGRVVYRWKFARVYPEKSYYRLTRVIPTLQDDRRCQGKAWGTKVFRGKEFSGEFQIFAGAKNDWRLVPKYEEEQFCRLTEKDERKPNIVPRTAPFPPLLDLLMKQTYEARGIKVSKPLKLDLKLSKAVFSSDFVYDEKM